MNWEGRLLDLFEDLEQQAEGLHLVERDAELADRSSAGYSQVALASRLHASAGTPVVLEVLGVGAVTGTLARVGRDWCLVRATAGEWMIRHEAIARARGLSERAVNEEARPLLGRLSFGSALRGLAGAVAVFHHVSGTQTRARVVRVGADFVEVVDDVAEAGRPRERFTGTELLAFGSIGAVRQA